MTKFFLETFYSMGDNLKNARNGKNASKIPKINGQVWVPWNEGVSFYDSLNFRKILKVSMGNVAGEQGLALQQHFPYKFLYSFKTSDCHKISSFNDGASNLAILIFLTCFFHFWHLLSYSP